MVGKNFILAGDAIFTVECPDGTHHTYGVQEVAGNERWPAARFVKFLSGPDNTSSYTYLGILDADTGVVHTTAKSRHLMTSLKLRLLNRILARVWADDHAAYEQHGYKTHHEGRCGRCGCTLTVPESIESGFGPECAKKMAMA
jgi:hypothetical protein